MSGQILDKSINLTLEATSDTDIAIFSENFLPISSLSCIMITLALLKITVSFWFHLLFPAPKDEQVAIFLCFFKVSTSFSPSTIYIVSPVCIPFRTSGKLYKTLLTPLIPGIHLPFSNLSIEKFFGSYRVFL